MVSSEEGFNEDRFRKLVARFDDTNPHEAETAFRLALDELRRNQLTFTDKLLNGYELERAREDCAEAEAELAELFERYAKREAEAGELEATLDMLHEHIAELEARAADAQTTPQPDEVETAPTPYTFFGEPEPDEGEASNTETLPAWNRSAQVSIFHMAYWGLLLASIIAYAVASWGLGHPLATPDDFDAYNHWPVLAVFVVLIAGIFAYFGRGINELEGSEMDGVRAEMTSPHCMFAWIGLLILAWTLLCIIWSAVTGTWLNYGARFIALLFMVIQWWLLSGKRHLENFGGRGLFLNIVLCLCLSFVCIIAPIDGGATNSELAKCLVVFALLIYPLCSDWLANWILDDERRFKWIAGVGVVCSLFAALVIYDDVTAHHAKTQSNVVTASSSEGNPAPQKAKNKRQLRKAPQWPKPEDFK